ncbi:MAG TPA: ANTAR domain-containing protein [Nakamurella sp.]
MVTDPQAAAVAAVSGATIEQVGRFSYDGPSDSWVWSDEIYAMYGFGTREVVPTTALMIAHQHPDDRTGNASAVLDALRRGRPFASRHRILDSRQTERLIVTVGNAERDGADEVRRIHGFMIDITGSFRRDLAESTHAAVEAAGTSRAAIDQAKGALMLVYGMDDDAAFELLKWYSQRSNIKLRELAETLVSAASQGMPVGGDSRRRLDEVFFGLAGGQAAAEPSAAPGELAATVTVEIGIPVLRVAGDVDLSTGPQFTALMAALVGQAERPDPVVVDLTGLGHLGSVGLAVLTQFHRRCQGKGTPLRVAFGDLAALPSVRSAGLSAFDSVERALAG